MRVLLLGDGFPEEAGGGYTLFQDVLHELLRISEDCKHKFYLIDHGLASLGGAEFPANFTRIRISRSFRRRVAERLIYEVDRHFRNESRPAPYFQAEEKELIRYQIDCALSVQPGLWSRTLPNIVTVFDLEHRRKSYFPELAANGEWEARERYYQKALPKAAAVIIGTEVGKRQVENLYGVDPAAIKVIPFPTPSFALKGAEAAPGFDLPAGVTGEFLFYPAQFWAHKNHVRLLQALKILRDRGWVGKLVCCGSDQGNLKFIQQRATELDIHQEVVFLGFVKRQELLALYRNALALTYVSYFGPDNLPPLEAFALGCPVIASAIEGAEETLGGAALYVNPDSASEIADAVLRLKKERGLRERLVAEGRTRALQSTAEGYVGQLIGLLDSLEGRFECFRK